MTAQHQATSLTFLKTRANMAELEEREFLVHFTRTLRVSLAAAHATVESIKQQVQERELVPAAALELYVDGRKLSSDANVPVAPVVVRVRQSGGLLGGKGGFGAMLRSQGKGSGAKATTDFGACRDLHGRRLRHVNQEIAMQKWREERGTRELRAREGISEREVLDEETPSGIPGWFLATPSWAEGIKKSYMKRRRNTVLCRHWVEARADGKPPPPPGAPRWWGCPRGRDCDYAHGEDELRGAGLTELKRAKQREVQAEKQRELQQYVEYEKDAPDDLMDAVRQGMRRRKQQQKPTKPLAPIEPSQTVAIVTSEAADWLVPCGTDAATGVTTAFRHGLCELRGRSNFGTAVATPDVRVADGKWYYEVRLVTAGVAQLGWAGAAFVANSEEGNGVGDHARSWAYDGFRRFKWTDGQDAEYGAPWSKNDVIGCLLDADAGQVAFSRNGEPLGVAFDSGVRLDGSETFFPAISVELAEILLVNFGAQPLLFLPEGYRPVMEALKREQAAVDASVSPVKSTPVSATQDSVPLVPQAAPSNKPETKQKPQASVKKVVQDLPPIDLDTFATVDALKAVGMDALKSELHHRGLKCGYVVSIVAADESLLVY